MFQSNALSWRPDHIPDEDNNNEDITVLLEAFFINLINTELQEQIANSKLLDTNAAEVLKILLVDRPTNLQDDLSDWFTKKLNRKHMLFYQGQYIPKDNNLQQQLLKQFHYPITTVAMGFGMSR